MEEHNHVAFSDADTLLHALRTQSEEFWITQGELFALSTFHKAAKHVPAYKDFLRKSGIVAEKIKTIEDFSAIPLIDKENYISQYELKDRCVGGELAQGSIVSYSSGSSGMPTLWPRFEEQEQESAILHEVFLREVLYIDTKKTLLVVCFAMGIHIAGVITVNALARLLKKKYPITLVTPGKNKDDVLSIITALGSEYEQIILFGHPGFVKTIVDELKAQGFAWKDKLFGCVVSGGGFFESWRDYLLDQVQQSSQPDRVSGLYGCTDAGALGCETPFSIAVRRHLRDDKEIAASFLGEHTEHEPNLFQYIPALRYIESVDGELVITASTGAPLVRYNIHDRGQVIPYKMAVEKLGNILPENAWQLPLVCLFGRPQMVVVNGANVYAEHIQRALEHEKCMPHITGRFVARVEYDETQNERFTIHIESKDSHTPAKELESWLTEHVVSSLIGYNKEYADCVRAMGKKVHPHIRLYVRGDAVFEQSAEGKKKL